MSCQWDFNRTKAFIDAVKGSIPSGDRDYNPETKEWFMKEQYGEAVRGFAQGVFGIAQVSFVGREATEQSERNRPTTHLMMGDVKAALTEFYGLVGETNTAAPIAYEVAKKMYRLAAARMHPDKGGDPAKMARLNELWTRIEKEHFKK